MSEPTLINPNELSKLSGKSFNTRSDANKVITNLIFSLEIAYDQLGLNSSNSSKPPSTDGFKKPSRTSSDQTASNDPEVEPKHHNKADSRKRRDKGYGRTQKLPVDERVEKQPSCCNKCSHAFTDQDKTIPFGGYYQVDFIKSQGINGFKAKNTLYITCKSWCPTCNDWTKYKTLEYKSTNGRIVKDNGLIGPMLSGFVAYANKELLLTISRIKDLLSNGWDLDFSTGTINTAIINAALCNEQQYEAIKEEVISSSYLYADETRWFEQSKTRWLWTFVTVTACLFMVGGRSKKMATEIINDRFNGWLMSDGYASYRFYRKRFRCLAHLKRKAFGLYESTNQEAHLFGEEALNLLNEIFSQAYKARDEGALSISSLFTSQLKSFKQSCLAHGFSLHSKTYDLATEFINDWDCIFRILEYPRYPLTNNNAERAIRHWVLARKISLGSQSILGSLATSILASVVATCKLKKQNIIVTVTNNINKSLGTYANSYNLEKEAA